MDDTGFVEVAGVRLAYRQVPPRPEATSSTPIVLSGGAFANVWSFQLIERALSRIAPMVVVDLPGCGLSDDRPGSFREVDLAGYLEGFLDRLGVGRVSLIGICAAGWPAFAFTAGAPDRVEALILGSTALGVPDGHRSALTEICRTLRSGDNAEAADQVLSMLMGPVTDPRVHQGEATRSLLRRTLRETGPHELTRMAIAVEDTMRANENLERRVSGVPALVYTGEYDRYTSPEVSRQVAGLVEGSRYCQIRATDHLVHIERPRELAALFGSFLTGASLDQLDFLYQPV